MFYEKQNRFARIVPKLNEVLNLKPSPDGLVQTRDCYMGRILRTRMDEASEKKQIHSKTLLARISFV